MSELDWRDYQVPSHKDLGLSDSTTRFIYDRIVRRSDRTTADLTVAFRIYGSGKKLDNLRRFLKIMCHGTPSADAAKYYHPHVFFLMDYELNAIMPLMNDLGALSDLKTFSLFEFKVRKPARKVAMK